MNLFRNHRWWLVKDIFLVSESLRLFLTKYQYRHRFKKDISSVSPSMTLLKKLSEKVICEHTSVIIISLPPLSVYPYPNAIFGLISVWIWILRPEFTFSSSVRSQYVDLGLVNFTLEALLLDYQMYC